MITSSDSENAFGKDMSEILRELGISAVVSGFGSIWVTYFLDGAVDRYEDLLRNDAELFVGYRRNLVEHGIFELPLNLKRNHISYAHSSTHIDQLLEATAPAVKEALEQK